MIICRLHEADLRDINLTGHKFGKKRVAERLNLYSF